MPLNLVTTGSTVLAADINQIVSVLQRSAGQTEIGSWYLNGWGNANGDEFGSWIPSLSRGATPVGITVDTSLLSPTNCNSPTVVHLDSNGFLIYTTTTGATTNAYAGGHYTIQY